MRPFSRLAPLFFAALFLKSARADFSSFQTLPKAVPPGAKVSLEADKTDWFLGENIVLHFKVENLGEQPFSVSFGGDYRGGARSERLKVTARDSAGRMVTDPNPNDFNFGGLGGAETIKKGEAFYDTFSLLPYCRFETPGEYEITAWHDLGWKVKPGLLPVAKIKLRLQMPTPQQARKVVDDLAKMPENQGVLFGTKNTQPWPDFSALCHPVYLPIIAPKIRAGDARFLTSIEALETPEATAFLAELLEAKPPIALVDARMPLKNEAPGLRWGNSAQQAAAAKLRHELVEKAWRKEFAPPVLAYARRAVRSDDRETLRLSASLLERVGQAPDLRLVIAALKRRLEKTVKTPRWQFVGDAQGQDNDGWQLQDDCLDLMQCGAALIKAGAALPAQASPGAIAIEVEAMKTNPQRFRAAWNTKAARYMAYRIPFLRQSALESVTPNYSPKPGPPVKLAPAVRALLPALLADSDVSVRVEACELAQRTRDKTLKSAILKCLAQTRNSWDAPSANRAAQSVGASFEAAQIWATRMDEPKLLQVALDSLLELTTGRGFSGISGPSEVSAATLKMRWQRFLRQNANFLRGGGQFAPGKLPPDLLPPNWGQ